MLDITLNKALELIQTRFIDNPISRTELSASLGVGDRTARHYIEKLREAGYRICGTSKDRGYYYPLSESEFEHFIKEYKSKAWTIIRRSNAMQGYTEGQVAM